MHKTVIAQINADMGKRAVEGIEEDQIARQKFGLRQRQRGLANRAAVTRQHDAGRLPVHVADEAAAIEPGFGRRATQAIRAADQADGIDRDIFRRGAGVSGQHQQQSRQGQQRDRRHGITICSIVRSEERLDPQNLDLEDRTMNDAPPPTRETSILENAQLKQLHDDAAAAASEPDLHERVRDLTARALHERRLALQHIGEIVGAITAGVGSGLAARGGEMKVGLKQAMAGIDDAVGSAAQAASYALQEAAAQGKAFKDTELKASLEQLRDLETQLVDTLKQTASQSGGKLKEELGDLSDHLKHNGTRTGEQVREALQQLAGGVKAGSEAGRAGLSETASTATVRLSQVASGILAALSDSLKRQSERLRS